MLKEGPLFLSLQMRQSLSVRPMRWLPDWKISLTDLHGGGADSCKLLVAALIPLTLRPSENTISGLSSQDLA